MSVIQICRIRFLRIKPSQVTSLSQVSAIPLNPSLLCSGFIGKATLSQKSLVKPDIINCVSLY